MNPGIIKIPKCIRCWSDRTPRAARLSPSVVVTGAEAGVVRHLVPRPVCCSPPKPPPSAPDLSSTHRLKDAGLSGKVTEFPGRKNKAQSRAALGCRVHGRGLYVFPQLPSTSSSPVRSFLARRVSWSARAAMTKPYKPSSLDNRNVLSHSAWDWSLRSRLWPGLGDGCRGVAGQGGRGQVWAIVPGGGDR